MIRVEIDDRELTQALERLRWRVADLSHVTRYIGELIVKRAKGRLLATSTAPDGRC